LTIFFLDQSKHPPTVYDKNGEKDTGQTIITINGTSSGFTVNMQAAQSVTEGGMLSVDIAPMIQTEDAGVLRYAIRYTDPDTNITTEYKDSASTVFNIPTPYGQLTFMPDTGTWSFIPSGILQAGESVTLNIQVLAELTSGSTLQDSGWQNMAITVTGVNDAPDMGTSVLHATLDGTNAAHENIGSFTWEDIDNDVKAQSGLFKFDTWNSTDDGSLNGVMETVEGQYGTLEVNTTTGSYTYILDSNKVGSEHRVVDSFEMNVTDPGSDGEGANAKTSTSSTLTIYGVDGTYVEGDAGNVVIDDILDSADGLGDGKSHVIWGGKGDDTVTLTGSSGQNVLLWKAGDAVEGEESTDNILDFNKTTNIEEGDYLDVRDLLSDAGVNARESITFEVDGINTTINIDLGNDTIQHIVLQGVALTAVDPSQGTFDELITQVKVLTM
jgi:VCBS repeat-containing protein